MEMEEVPLPLSAVIGAGLQCTQEADILVVTQADVESSVPLCSESRDVVTASKEMETEHGGSSTFEPVGKGENLHYTLDVSDDPLQADAHQPAAPTPTSLVPHQEITTTASLAPHSALVTRVPMATDPIKDYSPAPTTVRQSCSFPHAYTQQDAANSGISITVEGQDLWEEFYKRGTEMIVNRAGRRMFPGFAVTVSGLKPKQKYTMKMEMVLADKHRFKFLNCQWIAVGSADPQPPSIMCVHPDSPNSGGYWMRQGVSFRKIKITNNKDNPKGNVLLHSMHKYFLRLIIEEHKKGAPPTATPKTILVRDFPETTFITVTAYQNEEVTQLKITNNPFAKAFREGAGQYDWDALQMMYGPQSAPGQPPALHHPSGINPPPSACYGVASPMTPNTYLPSPGWCGSPHSLAAQPHPLTPHPHMFNRSSPGYGASLPSMFEWPAGQTMVAHGNRQLHSPLQSITPPIHPTFIDPSKPTGAFPAFLSPPPTTGSQGPVSTAPGTTCNPPFTTSASNRRLPQFNDFFGQPHAVGLTDEQHCF